MRIKVLMTGLQILHVSNVGNLVCLLMRTFYQQVGAVIAAAIMNLRNAIGVVNW